MTNWDFLDWGLDINTADSDVRLAGLITQLEREPQDADRDFLLRAAVQKQTRFVLCPPEVRHKLEAPARRWSLVGEDNRKKYLSVLRDAKSWEALGENRKKIEALHNSIVDIAPECEKAIFKTVLRVQEATAQFLATAHAPQRAMKEWKEVGTLKTIWGDWHNESTAPHVPINDDD